MIIVRSNAPFKALWHGDTGLQSQLSERVRSEVQERLGQPSQTVLPQGKSNKIRGRDTAWLGVECLPGMSDAWV